jgi:hypothetical protein
MHAKVVVLLAILAFSAIAVVPIKLVEAPSGTLTLSDAELMLPNVPPPTVDGFYQEWADGGGAFAGKVDVAGPGVRFDFTGLGKVGMGDKFVVSALAGGTGHDNGDFTRFSRYSLLFNNLGPDPINAHLFMNTGWSPHPWEANDTFWASDWVYVGVGQSVVLTLDFSSCGQVYNAMDDPVFEWQHPDGSGGWSVRRLDQFSNIGFEVLGSSSATVSVIVSGALSQPDLEFVVIAPHFQPFEYGDTFEVEVWVTDIYESSPLTGYDLNITYDPSLVLFKGVDYWGMLGNGTVISTPPVIEVEGQGGSWSGDRGLLFALTFHVELALSADHIWTKYHQSETFQIAIVGANLSFPQGERPMSEIIVPSPLSIEVAFIRGDVNCDGQVDIGDIGTVAYYYDKQQGDLEWPQASWYDLNGDNVIDIYDMVSITTNYGYGVSASSWRTLSMTDSSLTSPSGTYRWMDVANQAYGTSYRNSYNYSQATVTVNYYDVGNRLSGRVIARNLKPNFAYQLKLVGTPGTADNERIGLAGRWWQETWNGSAWTGGTNLNNKGDGTSPNPNDATYYARRFVVDSSSPTGYHYRYVGYLLFDYFVTDSNGDATIDFETGSCYHVLWKTSQRSHTADDGSIKTVTFDPDPSQPAYDQDYPSSTISIFGEWERLPMGNVNLAPGPYNCQLFLTEESFHGTGPLEGNWAAAMSGNLTFTIS